MKLSVIIPSYNQADKLKICLQRLAEQEISKDIFEIVVIDDGSIDHTQDIVKQFQKNTSLAIEYFREENQGRSVARNLGIEKAKGEIILFIGSDIMVAKGFLKEHLIFHDKYKNNSVVILGYTSVCPRVSTPFLEWYNKKFQFGYQNLKHGDEISWRYFYTSNISLKRKFLTESKERFNEGFKKYGWEGTEFGYRLYTKGMKFFYNQRASACHDHAIDLGSAKKQVYGMGQSAQVFYKINKEAAELSDIKTLGYFKMTCARMLMLFYPLIKFLGIKFLISKCWSAILYQEFNKGLKIKLK